MGIQRWPSDERPREKLLKHGASSLSDAELLAIFLRAGSSGQSALDLARSLLRQFGGLRALMSAPQEHVCQVRGLGEANFTKLQASLEMAHRHFQESLNREAPLKNPAMVRHLLRLRLRDAERELFAGVFLDSQHRLIQFETLFYGSISSTAVYPREVAKRCLALNAAALIVAHNHPSGVPEPSDADVRLTERLQAALALLDIRLLDHCVIGDSEVVSLAERGLMKPVL